MNAATMNSDPDEMTSGKFPRDCIYQLVPCDSVAN